MQFKTYKKIQALHKEESDGILNGICYIQEKIDGANTSIWLEDGEIHCGSRTRDLTKAGDGFNGFVEYVKNHDGINRLLKEVENIRLNGEWLVRHTIGYNELNYKNFYLFDIEIDDNVVSIEHMYKIAEEYGIKTAHLFDVKDNPTLEDIKKHAGKSVLGLKGEGVVIKNLNFINKFGDTSFAKYVTQEFKEDNAVTFGGNNKSSETYNEMYYVNKFMTLSRVTKIFHKLESMEGRLDMKHIPRIMGMCYHDLITEEAWVIAQEMGKSGKFFDFKSFKGLCDKKSKSIFIELLTGDVSVAHVMHNQQ
jgi:ATP-dependent RNA circularization protein (DNA/RNA ligase family)